MPSQQCTKPLHSRCKADHSNNSRNIVRCSHYIPIISWFYPHHAYHPSIFLGYIPNCSWFYDQPFASVAPGRLAPNGGGACPWCCTASGNSPWSSPQSANHERCQSAARNIYHAKWLEHHILGKSSILENNRFVDPQMGFKWQYTYDYIH